MSIKASNEALTVIARPYTIHVTWLTYTRKNTNNTIYIRQTLLNTILTRNIHDEELSNVNIDNV